MFKEAKELSLCNKLKFSKPYIYIYDLNCWLFKPGAYEGFCLRGEGAQIATVCPPLKNPFFEKILIPFFYFFLPPLPPGLVLFTIKIHQKDYIFGWLLTLESKNYSFAWKTNFLILQIYHLTPSQLTKSIITASLQIILLLINEICSEIFR